MDAQIPPSSNPPAPLSSGPRPGIGEWLWLALWLGIGGLLRVWNVAGRPLWTDEFTTLITLRRDLRESFFNFQDPQPPLYQLLLRPFIDVSGTVPGSPSELILRAPALVAGILAIVAAWWFARSVAGRGTAIIVVMLVAVNPWLIAQAREARPYSLFLLTATLATIAFYRLLQRGGWVNIVAAAVALALLWNSHYYAMFYLAGIIVFAVLDAAWGGPARRRLLPLTVAVALGIVLAALPLIMFAWMLKSGMPGAWWIGRPNPIAAFETLGDLLGLQALGVLCVIPLGAALWPGPTALDVDASTRSTPDDPSICDHLGTLGISWQRRRGAVFCTLIVIFGLFVPVVISIILKPGFVPRYAVPVVVPLLTAGVAYLMVRNRVVLLLLVLLLLAFTIPKAIEETRPRPGLRDIAAVLQQRTAPGDRVLVADWSFSTDYINPEIVGLEYHGLRDRQLTPLPVAAIERKPREAHLELIPDGRLTLVAFGGTVNKLQEHLIYHGRRYRIESFGDKPRTVHLLTIEPRPLNLEPRP